MKPVTGAKPEANALGNSPDNNVPIGDNRVAPTTRPTWHDMLAQFEQAEKTADEYDQQHWAPLWQDERDRWPEAQPSAGQLAWREATGYSAVEAHVDALRGKADDLCNALIEMPAPDSAALLWKLDYLLAADEGLGQPGESTAAWLTSYLEQTKADYRRILGGEA